MPAEQIVFRGMQSALGKLIIGATCRGCCLLEYEDRGGPDKILQRIAKRFKSELAEGTNALLDQLEAELEQYFNGLRKNFSAPLELRGTPFQRAVWRQLLDIPYGETRTYGEMATLVGRPQAFRALGRANGDNPLAIVIPCHRVVQHDGKLRGYGGGLWRKEYLLALESRHAAKQAAFTQEAPSIGSGTTRAKSKSKPKPILAHVEKWQQTASAIKAPSDTE